jgi:hypothetical protein
MMPERHRFREKPVDKRSNSGWITQVAVVLLIAAGFLAWQSPAYWAQKWMPNVAAAKARAL